MDINKRTCMTKNNYMRFLANMSAQEVDIDRLTESGKYLDAKIAAIIAEETAKGNEGLKVVPDLLDLKVLANKEVFTDDIKQILSLAMSASDNVSALVDLGFNYPTSFSNFNIASAQISTLLKKVAIRLYNNIMGAVNQNGDEVIIDLTMKAIRDQIAERMSFESYADEHGINVPEDEKTAEIVKLSYNSDYNEWLDEECDRIFLQVVTSPLANVIIRPTGVDKVKDVLYEICPPEANEYITNMTANELYEGAIFEKLMNEYKIDQESLRRFAGVVETFINENTVPQSMDIGMGQGVNPFYSVNMPSIILHMMIMTSAELWSPNELSEEAEYVLDIVRNELTNINSIEYDPDFTPQAVLSVVSNYLNIIVSRSSLMRSSAQDYMLAQGAIGMGINEILMKEKLEGMENGSSNQ